MNTLPLEKSFKTALILSIITIGYNLTEGIISTIFGATDETLVLFGFGIDSFVEVLSGVGIAHMILRLKKHPIEQHDNFEVTALRITGIAFYILVGGLIIGAILLISYGSEPQTTKVGIIISTVSIATMYILYRQKLKVGKDLNSEPIISDANCTKTCFYLSFILLGSSAIYELFRIPYIDAIGSLGIAWYAYKEGKEAFEKAKAKTMGCSDHC
jgi:divalent metal cation (Fe/Co/Zn/Cd) transporter